MGAWNIAVVTTPTSCATTWDFRGPTQRLRHALLAVGFIASEAIPGNGSGVGAVQPPPARHPGSSGPSHHREPPVLLSPAALQRPRQAQRGRNGLAVPVGDGHNTRGRSWGVQPASRPLLTGVAAGGRMIGRPGQPNAGGRALSTTPATATSGAGSARGSGSTRDASNRIHRAQWPWPNRRVIRHVGERAHGGQ